MPRLHKDTDNWMAFRAYPPFSCPRSFPTLSLEYTMQPEYLRENIREVVKINSFDLRDLRTQDQRR